MPKFTRIGVLARRTGVPIETIRYYEREGLIHKAIRSAGNYRLYTETHCDRLSFIRHCRALDMTLDEIRELLRLKDTPDDPCQEIDALLDAHIGHVTERIAELQRLKAQLRKLRAGCGLSSARRNCGILSGLSRRVAPSSTPLTRAHVSGSHRRWP